MSIMRRLLGLWMASLALMLALLSGPAHSNVSIPSGTNASNDLVLNFDLSSLLPSGYTNFIDIIVEYSFSSPDAGGGNGSGGCCLVPVTMDFFSGLNGGGSLLQTSSVGIQASCCIPPQLTSSNSGLIDGIFSIGVRVGPGVTATLNGVTAAGFYALMPNPIVGQAIGT